MAGDEAEFAEPFGDGRLGWWLISGAVLLGALREVAHGADPDVVYAELYANSDLEYPGDREDTP